ncbi:hypothetical protein BS78_03G145000 [Paspalum vaginatum]|nr:hypothetical protein BS78_03G145000 [Paspalum vaginatum]
MNVGIYKPKEDEEMTHEMVQDMYRNAQAVSILLGHLEGEEYWRVEGLNDAKLIWDTIMMSHEDDNKSRRQTTEMLEGQLSHFAMRRDESLKSLFDRLMTLVNKIRALGSKEWKDDNKVTRLLMRAYQVKDKNLAKIVKDRDDYEHMKPHHLYAKLQQHEAEDEVADKQIREVNALAARKSNNIKYQKDDECDDEESTSEDEDENVVMFIKSFRKIVRSGDKYHRKGKKRPCYKCGESGHFIVECPSKGQEGNEFKKEYKRDKYKRVKATMDEKDVELANAKPSMDELKGAKDVLQQNISSLEVQYKELQVQFDTLWNTTSTSSSVPLDSSASTSNGCKKCYDHDMNSCATNLEKVGILEEKVKQFELGNKEGKKSNNDQPKKERTQD